MVEKTKKKKNTHILLKKRLHPLLSYAALLGVGAVAVSSTGSLAGANIEKATPVPIAVHAQAKTATPTDLDDLKTSASEFASQLSTIKSQVAELKKYGHAPTPALTDAIGRGDQLVSMIMEAQTLKDIGESDPAAKLQSIGAAIAANSKF